MTTSESISSRWSRRCYAVLLLLIGTSLLAGGVMLAAYGGSIYYLIAGLVVAASGVLVWRRNRRGAWLYGAILAATLVWAIYEVGSETCGLVPRLVAPFVIGIPLLFRSIRGTGGPASTPRRFAGLPAFGGALVLAAFVGAGLHAIADKPVDPLWQRGAAGKAPNALLVAQRTAICRYRCGRQACVEHAAEHQDCGLCAAALMRSPWAERGFMNASHKPARSQRSSRMPR